MNKRISSIIFSRDRAMQLDATLHSFLLHCQDADKTRISVIFRATTPQHKKQYDQLILWYQKNGIIFIEEKDFHSDLLNLMWAGYIKEFSRWQRYWAIFSRLIRIPIRCPITIPLPKTNRFVLFLVDDNLFVRDFNLAQHTRELDAHPDALGYSLRLGRNTVYCYPLESGQTLPKFISLLDGSLMFTWVGADKDFGYPLEVSSSIYRLSDILGFVNRLQFHNPNELEGQMASWAHRLAKSQPALLCSPLSITFCNPVNRVQKVAKNITGKYFSYSSNQLAELFDQGKRIDVDAYSGFISNGCHQEVELHLIKGSKA